MVPSWRNDVSRDVDVIEEVGRHFGLGRIPASLPPAESAAGLSLSQRKERRLRQVLVAAGFAEVVNLSFVRGDVGLAGETVQLKNPLSEDQAILRRSLVLPGLVETLLTNLRQGRRELALFEMGRVFEPAEGLPREPHRLGLLAYGPFGPVHWSGGRRSATFFDLKGVLEAMGARLGVQLAIDSAAGAPAHLHPGQASTVRLGADVIGWVGVLHPDVSGARGFREDVVVAEIDLEPVLLAGADTPRFASLVRFPVGRAGPLGSLPCGHAGRGGDRSRS